MFFDLNSHELIRLVTFMTIMLIMIFLEILIPHREGKHTRLQRWPGNILVLVIGNFLLRFISPLLPYTLALKAESSGYMLAGLETIPIWGRGLLTFVILDLSIYIQHMGLHLIPGLRDFHRMHHTDTHMDFTTALRFHPLEIVFSTLYKSLLVSLLGMASMGVFLFEVILNGSAMFNHGNIELPSRLDRILRLFIVTPDYHRIHHSRVAKESNSNYGFFLTIWDRVFSTYTPKPSKDRKKFALGVPGYNEPKLHRIDKLFLDPFRSLFKR